MTAALVVGAAGSGQAADTMPGMSGSMSNMSAAQMAKLHEQSTKAFPAKTEGLGNQPLAPTMENGWKVFHLVAQEIKWEVAPNQFVQAFAYNGMVPGPEIHVRSGDRIRVVLQNELTQPTTLHFHGASHTSRSRPSCPARRSRIRSRSWISRGRTSTTPTSTRRSRSGGGSTAR
jgi:FtsP/CotA-like multicopper oxidase with cupredoxin domain